MATKSILKNIDIKDRKLGKALVLALENASKKKNKEVSLSRTYQDIRGEQIKDLLGKKS